MLGEAPWILIVPNVYNDIVLFTGHLTIATAIRRQRSSPEPGYQVVNVGLSEAQTGYKMIGFWILAASPHRIEGNPYSRLPHWYIETMRGEFPTLSG